MYLVEGDGLARAQEVLEGAPELLSDHERKVVLRRVGMHVTRQVITSSASGASGLAERIGFPVMLKALSPDLRRRSEVGAVALALGNEPALTLLSPPSSSDAPARAVALAHAVLTRLLRAGPAPRRRPRRARSPTCSCAWPSGGTGSAPA